MKKLIICLFVPTLFTPLSLFAQPSKYLKIGVNYSSCRTKGSKSEPGLTIGFDKNYYPIQSHNGFWGFGISYVQKKAKLENKTWPTDFDPTFSNVEIGDLQYQIGYLEIPINIGYDIIRENNRIFLKVYTGSSLSIPIHKNSAAGSRTLILDPDQKGKFKFDYLRWDGVGALSTLAINLHADVAFYYGRVGIDFHYSRAISEIKPSGALTVQHKLDSFQITLLYAL